MPILVGAAAVVIGLLVGYNYRRNIAEAKIGRAEDSVKKLVDDAQKRAEVIKKETVLEAQEEVHRLRNEFDKEVKERRNEINKTEKRLVQKEETLDKKNDNVAQKEEVLEKRAKEITKIKEDLETVHTQQLEQLEHISGMSIEDAKGLLLEKVEHEARHDMAVMLRDIEQKAKDEADKKARNILSLAIQKCAADHVAESTVSVVNLPNDEMKGRIIGREGRNIRALETATGIDLIIDDTPEAVILSGFDPVRREVARLALEKLIVDGRIHPARIEEMVNKAQKEVD
ncbi:Rnase Y domain-containing protein, partial [Christensenellaceae bacterium OttesenSCG-928-K19]|nr:Rnase Y domain-containing protein [Christensenellaceae bacterium OttesenSCG-928-K19]